MPFRPGPKNPDFSRLRSTLAQIKSKDNALYETIANLIDWLTQFKINTEKALADINASINNILSIINNLPDKFRTYITWTDESLNLPNSRQLLAGKAVTFDDSVVNERTVNADLPVGTLFSTAINVNPSILLGYGTWILFATGTGSSGNPLVITVQ